jgi:hypothetical protein
MNPFAENTTAKVTDSSLLKRMLIGHFELSDMVDVHPSLNESILSAAASIGSLLSW